MGYTGLAASTRRGVHQAPLRASPPSIEPPSIEPPHVNADEPSSSGGNVGELVKQATEHSGSDRSAEFNIGASSSRPGAAEEVEGLAEDAALPPEG